MCSGIPQQSGGMVVVGHPAFHSLPCCASPSASADALPITVEPPNIQAVTTKHVDDVIIRNRIQLVNCIIVARYKFILHVED